MTTTWTVYAIPGGVGVTYTTPPPAAPKLGTRGTLGEAVGLALRIVEPGDWVRVIEPRATTFRRRDSG